MDEILLVLRQTGSEEEEGDKDSELHGGFELASLFDMRSMFG